MRCWETPSPECEPSVCTATNAHIIVLCSVCILLYSTSVARLPAANRTSPLAQALYFMIIAYTCNLVRSCLRQAVGALTSLSFLRMSYTFFLLFAFLRYVRFWGETVCMLLNLPVKRIWNRVYNYVIAV